MKHIFYVACLLSATLFQNNFAYCQSEWEHDFANELTDKNPAYFSIFSNKAGSFELKSFRGFVGLTVNKKKFASVRYNATVTANEVLPVIEAYSAPLDPNIDIARYSDFKIPARITADGVVREIVKVSMTYSPEIMTPDFWRHSPLQQKPLEDQLNAAVTDADTDITFKYTGEQLFIEIAETTTYHRKHYYLVFDEKKGVPVSPVTDDRLIDDKTPMPKVVPLTAIVFPYRSSPRLFYWPAIDIFDEYVFARDYPDYYFRYELQRWRDARRWTEAEARKYAQETVDGRRGTLEAYLTKPEFMKYESLCFRDGEVIANVEAKRLDDDLVPGVTACLLASHRNKDKKSDFPRLAQTDRTLEVWNQEKRIFRNNFSRYQFRGGFYEPEKVFWNTSSLSTTVLVDLEGYDYKSDDNDHLVLTGLLMRKTATKRASSDSTDDIKVETPNVTWGDFLTATGGRFSLVDTP